MRVVVGYESNRRGLDAINLATTLARAGGGATSAVVDLVVVLSPDTPTFDMYSPDRAFQNHLQAKAEEWLEEAKGHVPVGLEVRTHVVRAESVAEGLTSAATDPRLGEEAGLLVLGPAKRGLVGRFSIGGNASALLHSSPVPVALAPAKYQAQPAVTRVTCATGTRPGAEALVDLAIGLSRHWEVPLRLMSLLALKRAGSKDERHELKVVAKRHVSLLVDQARATLGDDGQVSGTVGTGKSLEDCVRKLDFEDSEVVMVGSSRLAGPKQLFIGASASKILHALPVPMIVVPRDYEAPAL